MLVCTYKSSLLQAVLILKCFSKNEWYHRFVKTYKLPRRTHIKCTWYAAYWYADFKKSYKACGVA